LMVPLLPSSFVAVLDKLAPNVAVFEPVDLVRWQLGGRLGASKNKF
jgi:hypothetical protein